MDSLWNLSGAAGDNEGFERRLIDYPQKDPTRHEVLCLPDNWGIPSIGGDGTVYASSGHNGNLYAIRDENVDGAIDETEIKTFKTGQAFLNGPALAPGMLVAAPCWGPMYVFKDP